MTHPLYYLLIQSSVKKNKKKETTNIESEHAAVERINATKFDMTKQKLIKQKYRIPDQQDKWQGKLDKLNK